MRSVRKGDDARELVDDRTAAWQPNQRRERRLPLWLRVRVLRLVHPHLLVRHAVRHHRHHHPGTLLAPLPPTPTASAPWTLERSPVEVAGRRSATAIQLDTWQCTRVMGTDRRDVPWEHALHPQHRAPKARSVAQHRRIAASPHTTVLTVGTAMPVGAHGDQLVMLAQCSRRDRRTTRWRELMLHEGRRGC